MLRAHATSSILDSVLRKARSRVPFRQPTSDQGAEHRHDRVAPIRGPLPFDPCSVLQSVVRQPLGSWLSSELRTNAPATGHIEWLGTLSTDGVPAECDTTPEMIAAS